MDEPHTRITRTSGLNPRRAGCSETGTSGSEGGPQKPTGRKTGRALRPDPYTDGGLTGGFFHDGRPVPW